MEYCAAVLPQPPIPAAAVKAVYKFQKGLHSAQAVTVTAAQPRNKLERRLLAAASVLRSRPLWLESSFL